MDFYGGDDLFGHLHGPELDEDGKARAGVTLGDGVAVAAESQVIGAMREVYDPEIPVNIYELGLIYNYEIIIYSPSLNSIFIILSISMMNYFLFKLINITLKRDVFKKSI